MLSGTILVQQAGEQASLSSGQALGKPRETCLGNLGAPPRNCCHVMSWEAPLCRLPRSGSADPLEWDEEVASEFFGPSANAALRATDAKFCDVCEHSLPPPCPGDGTEQPGA